MLWLSRWNRTGEHRKPRILNLADRNFLVDDPQAKIFTPFGDAQAEARNSVRSHTRSCRPATVHQGSGSHRCRPFAGGGWSEQLSTLFRIRNLKRTDGSPIQRQPKFLGITTVEIITASEFSGLLIRR
jgi:hypothetical protein